MPSSRLSTACLALLRIAASVLAEVLAHATRPACACRSYSAMLQLASTPAERCCQPYAEANTCTGTAEVDAHTILLTLCVFVFISFPFGIATASTIRVGNLLGANRPGLARISGKPCFRQAHWLNDVAETQLHGITACSDGTSSSLQPVSSNKSGRPAWRTQAWQCHVCRSVLGTAFLPLAAVQIHALRTVIGSLFVDNPWCRRPK